MSNQENMNQESFVASAREAFATVKKEFQSAHDKHAAIDSEDDQKIAKTKAMHVQYIEKLENVSDSAIALMQTYGLNPTKVARSNRESKKKIARALIALESNSRVTKDNALAMFCDVLKMRSTRKHFSLSYLQKELGHSGRTQARYILNLCADCGCVKEIKRADKDSTYTLDRDNALLQALQALAA